MGAVELPGTEHYSDFGSIADGKPTLRVQPDRRFVVRGSADRLPRAVARAVVLSSTATNS
jgi:hypothetical protein